MGFNMCLNISIFFIIILIILVISKIVKIEISLKINQGVKMVESMIIISYL